jgi:hypothetical protein
MPSYIIGRAQPHPREEHVEQEQGGKGVEGVEGEEDNEGDLQPMDESNSVYYQPVARMGESEAGDGEVDPSTTRVIDD